MGKPSPHPAPDSKAPPSESIRPNYLAWWLLLPLIAITWIAFAPVLANGFVDIDDNEAFLTNPHFRGLGWEQVSWAATTPWLGAYQPLGWWIFEFEYVTSGLEPQGYHLASLVMHTCTAVAIYLLTLTLLPRILIGVPRNLLTVASAIAAAAFATHPMRTESVAWASSQSYLPCACLAVLSVVTYLRAQDTIGGRRWVWLFVSGLLYTFSLAAKSVPLALALVLLLLDVYPLRRYDSSRSRLSNISKLIIEKLPYLAIGFAFAMVAVWARSTDEGLATIETVGVATRIAHACYSTGFYAIRSIVPLGLHACYPMNSWLSWQDPRLAFSTLGCLAFALLAARQWKQRPWIAVIAGCYFAILLPNSGLVRNTTVLAADRYGYLATIPLFLAAGGGLAWLVQKLNTKAIAPAIPMTIACLAIAGLVALSRDQARTWHDSVTVWSRSVEAEPSSDPYLYSRLGRALIDQKQFPEAELNLKLAVSINPTFAMAQSKLGLALLSQAKHDEAMSHLNQAILLNLDDAEARINLGYILAERGQWEAAESQFAEAARAKPNLATAFANLGAAQVQRQKFTDAANSFERQIQIEPNNPSASMNLGFSLVNLNKFEDASSAYERALSLQPNDAGAHHNLGHCLARLGRFTEAEAQYHQALEIDPKLDASRQGLRELLAARAGGRRLRR